MSEQTIWKGTPSQWSNFTTYLICAVFCFAIFPIFYALYIYLKTQCQEIEITTERFIVKSGILSKTTYKVELFKVVDVIHEEPFILRLKGLSTLTFIAADAVDSAQKIVGIPNGEKISEDVRNAIKKMNIQQVVFNN